MNEDGGEFERLFNSGCFGIAIAILIILLTAYILQ